MDEDELIQGIQIITTLATVTYVFKKFPAKIYTYKNNAKIFLKNKKITKKLNKKWNNLKY